MDLAYLNRKFNDWSGYSESDWARMFLKIREKAAEYEEENRFSTAISHQDENVEKNRYLDVRPFDHCRVVLGEKPEHDYINASPIELDSVRRNYILAQGPLAHTCADFWQMIFEKNSQLVIMLNNIMEQYMVKCHRYFPDSQEPVLFAYDAAAGRRFRVTLISEEDHGDFIIRELELALLSPEGPNEDESGDFDRKILETRAVTHYQYTTWPDFGCPKETGHFLAFREHLKSSGKLESDSSSGPVVIHCSAGIGRTGTFVVIDTILASVEYDIALPEKSFEDWVLYLRRFRRGLIQTPHQLRFSWQSIVDSLQQTNKISRGRKKKSTSSSPSEASSTGGNITLSENVTKKRSLAEIEQDKGVVLSKRKETIEAMRRKLKESEAKRNSSTTSWVTVICSAGLAGVASVCFYYYFIRNG
uniref:protein-tyrosine-phosphatase n=1 Tax=Steinernema glaseri TaxID=37863 RepID=A0A1I8A6H7_9BILA